MTFHNHGPQYGPVTQIAGNQYNSGGQQYTNQVSVDSVRGAVVDLRAALRAVSLSAVDGAQARAAIDSIDVGLTQPQPDKGWIARHLEMLSRIFVNAGALVTNGQLLMGPIQTIAGWLGALGAPILRLLT